MKTYTEEQVKDIILRTISGVVSNIESELGIKLNDIQINTDISKQPKEQQSGGNECKSRQDIDFDAYRELAKQIKTVQSEVIEASRSWYEEQLCKSFDGDIMNKISLSNKCINNFYTALGTNLDVDKSTHNDKYDQMAYVILTLKNRLKEEDKKLESDKVKSYTQIAEEIHDIYYNRLSSGKRDIKTYYTSIDTICHFIDKLEYIVNSYIKVGYGSDTTINGINTIIKPHIESIRQCLYINLPYMFPTPQGLFELMLDAMYKYKLSGRNKSLYDLFIKDIIVK